jgi:hypothetical protein
MVALRTLLCSAVLLASTTAAFGAYYRGGALLPVKTGEFVCRAGTTPNDRRGVSLFNVSSKIPAAYQNPLNLVGSLNTTRLAIEQRATDLAHFEIVPVLAECNGATVMTQATYETLLKGVTLTAQ